MYQVGAAGAKRHATPPPGRTRHTAPTHNQTPATASTHNKAPSQKGPGLFRTQNKGERMTEPTRDAYSIQETAKRWGVSDNTIRTLIDTGQLYAFRVGRQLRIPTTELNRLANTPANPAHTRKETK